MSLFSIYNIWKNKYLAVFYNIDFRKNGNVLKKRIFFFIKKIESYRYRWNFKSIG